MIDTSKIDLLAHVGKDTALRKVAGTNGGEYAGACPVCGGTDRFRVWPQPSKGQPSYWCRACDFKGNVISYVMKMTGMTFPQACDYLNLQRPVTTPVRGYRREEAAPVSLADHDEARACFNPAWQKCADIFVTRCFHHLNGGGKDPAGEAGRRYLESRGLPVPVWASNDLGFNPTARQEVWGGVEVWLPRGIVIPWEIGFQYWNIRIRRLSDELRPGEAKYMSVKGNANGLYRGDVLGVGATALMVEGEINAITLQMVINRTPRLHGLVAVATGSASGARLLRWATRLALCKQVLTMFDDDPAGRAATAFWAEALGKDKVRALNAEADANDMHRLGLLAGWLEGVVQ